MQAVDLYDQGPGRVHCSLLCTQAVDLYDKDRDVYTVVLAAYYVPRRLIVRSCHGLILLDGLPAGRLVERRTTCLCLRENNYI